MTKRSIRVSASRLKTLKQCSLYFYYQEIGRIPTPIHHRTAQGSATHAIFEHLFHPKRRVALQAILTDGFNIDDWPSIARYIRFYDHRHHIAPYVMSEMGDMLRVAFLGIRRHFFDDKGKWSPPPRILTEHRFQFKIGDAVMSGFIDLLLLWDDRAIICDLKSQRNKFSKAELPHNVQSFIYMLAVRHEFGFIPPVEFILLRHPPGPRAPDKHIQRVDPPSPVTLSGLAIYISDMHDRLNQFGLQEAYANPCQDEGFCQRVCPYLKPYSYYLVCRADDPTGDDPISSHLSVDSATQATYATENSVILERCHAGCPIRYRQT